MSLETIRNQLDYYEKMLNKQRANIDSLIELTNHILEKSSTQKNEAPKLQEANPIRCPQIERYIPLSDMRAKYGDIISPNHVGRLLKRYPDFFDFCAFKCNGQYSIQPLRALHYLWNIVSDSTKMKIKNYSEISAMKSRCNSGVERSNTHQCITEAFYPQYPWWSVSYTTDDDYGDW